MVNLASIVQQIIPFELGQHAFWWEVISLVSVAVALVLITITLHAYRRHRLRRLIPLSAAFGLFVVKVALLHLDDIYPSLQGELAVASVAAELGMLTMIFLAVVR